MCSKLIHAAHRGKCAAGIFPLHTCRSSRGVLSQTFDVPSARDMSALSESWREAFGVIEFKGVHYPKSVILHAVFFYLRYAVS